METTISYAMPDEELAERFQAGDASAGEELARRYMPLVRSLCSPSFVRTFADDLAQDLWCRFFEALHAYDPEKNPSFAGYMKAILTYGRWNAFKAIRRRWDREAECPEEGCGELFWEEDMTKMSEKDLQEFIMTLPLSPRQKDILLLLLDGPQSLTELGRKIGISRQAVQKAMEKVKITCRQLEQEDRFL